MACIVYQTNKKTGVQYAYRSESYRDPVTKKPTSRRTYLGRVDPNTKAIIGKAESGRRNRSKVGEDSPDVVKELKAAEKKVQELEKKVESLQASLNQMTANQKKSSDILRKIAQLAKDV